MNIQSVTRDQALERLRLEQIRYLEKNQSGGAQRMQEAHSVLSRGEGETIWDVYRNAGDKARSYERMMHLVTPPAEEHNDSTPLKKHWGVIGAGAVATVAASYLRTGDLGSSLAWGLLPLGAGLLGAWFVADQASYYGNDSSIPVALTISAASTAWTATGNWLPPVATAAGLVTAVVGSGALLRAGRNRQLAIQEVIDGNKHLILQPPKTSSLADLGRKLSKREILGTLNRLKNESVAGGDFKKAMELREASEMLSKSKGDNFYDMLVQGDQAQRDLLSAYTEEILEDARQRSEVKDLVDGLDGTRAAADLLVGLDSVTAGEHEIPIAG